MTGDEELLAVFRAEAEDQIGLLAEALAADPETWDMARLFRLAHSIKGASRLVDARELANAAHLLENLLSQLREGRPLDAEVVGLARAGGLQVEEAFAGWDATLPTALAAVAEPPVAEPPATEADNGTLGRAAPAAMAGEEVATADTTLRIGSDRLEDLTGLVAELAVAAGSISGLRELARGLEQQLNELFRGTLDGHPAARSVLAASRRLGGALQQSAARQEKLGAELGDLVSRLRMVSIDSLRNLLSRTVRDAARRRGIDAELKVSGGDTAIDRGLLAALRDPLIQLLRNAVAHGLERAEERRWAGKNERGLVRLEARAEGSWVEIAVADDGRGLDRDALIRAAVARGLWAEDEDPDTERLSSLLFEAGFSTAENIDELAGRGVGLDVVRSNIDRLGGEVRVTSVVGGGTTFVLRVPLTRLTMRVLKIRLGDDYYLLPVTQIERVFTVRGPEVAIADGQPSVECRGAPVTLGDLRTFFGHPASPLEGKPAVLIERRGRRRAFLVDAVLGELEAVLQPLPWNLRHLPGIAGLAILDGERVLPILDPGDLLDQAQTLSLAATGHRESRRRRILVADDSVTSRTLERNILAAAGYEVEVAIDGGDAWEKLRRSPPDLLITDVDMPTLSGIELTRKLRADRQLHLLPIILVTSLGQAEDRERGAEAGANAYIVKGAFDQDELLRAVARLL